MILWLLPYITKTFPFAYVSLRMLAAAMCSLAVTVCLGKRFIQMLVNIKLGHTVRVGDVAALANQYGKSKEVPSMGGVLFLTTLFFTSFLFLDLRHSFSWILLATVLWMGGIGFVDDLYKFLHKTADGIRPRVKMFLQLTFAAGLATYLFTSSPMDKSYCKAPVAKERCLETGKLTTLSTKQMYSRWHIPFMQKPIVLSGVFVAFAIGLMMFVIVGSTNAVNLTDGLDGLAAGLALLVASILAVFAFASNHADISQYLHILYIEGSGEIAIFLSALVGSLLGFLWFNGFPAEVFMGDTGSLGLGAILGVSAILLRQEFLYALLAGVFVIETLSVILQIWSFKYRDGKRIFLCAPLHHHLQLLGWHEMKIVLRLWMIGLFLALLGLASLKV